MTADDRAQACPRQGLIASCPVPRVQRPEARPNATIDPLTAHRLASGFKSSRSAAR
jgi:hypothetical protein